VLLQQWRRGKLALVVLSAAAILLTLMQFSELALLTKSARELTNDAPITQQQQQQQQQQRVNNATKNHKQEKNRKQMHHANRNNTKAPSVKNGALFNEGSVGIERNNKKRNNIDTQNLYMELSLSSNTTTNLGIVEPQYISATMDWWGLGTESWDNSSILNADLQNPNLKAMAKGLGPSFLRIGGSQADQILYYMNKHSDSSSNKNNIDKYLRNEEEEEGEALARECQRKPQKCLTSNRWLAILDFAHNSNMRIVFTLAYIRHTRNENGTHDMHDWDSTNARSFLDYTASSNHAHLIYGFELGNELRHKGKMTNVTRMVLAYRELRQLVNDVWKAKTNNTMGNSPKILGPASTGGGETSELVSNLWPYIDIVTYHKYHGGGKDPNMIKYSQQPSFHVHPMKLVGPGVAVLFHLTTTNGVKTSFNHINSSTTTHSRHFNNYSRLWIGEGAMAYNSGLQGVSDSFGGSLWFANLLGALAKTRPLSHGVYCRQSLLGGHYELIDHISLLPNPDYWVAYIWKNLVGRRAIGPILSPGRKDSIELSSKVTFGCCEKPGMDTILIHSFCAKKKYNLHHNNADTNYDVNDLGGDVIFIIINISEVQGMNLNFTLNYNNRTEYILQPNSKKDGMHARAVLLNGIPMLINKIDDNTVDLPKIHNHGISRTHEEIAYIHPISIAFIVLHSTDVTVCQ